MSFIVTIVHVFVSLFLMLTVLLQAGKGGGMGATFGGGSSQGSVFGGSGAGNFLSRLTTASAAIFMITSMTLAFLASTTGEDSLKKFSAQQRQAAQQKADRDKEAQELYLDTQPDAPETDDGVDGLDVDGADLDGVDDGTEATPEGDALDNETDSADAPDEPTPAPAAAAIEPAPATKPAAAAIEPAPATKPAAEPKPAPATKPAPTDAPGDEG